MCQVVLVSLTCDRLAHWHIVTPSKPGLHAQITFGDKSIKVCFYVALTIRWHDRKGPCFCDELLWELFSIMLAIVNLALVSRTLIYLQIGLSVNLPGILADWLPINIGDVWQREIICYVLVAKAQRLKLNIWKIISPGRFYLLVGYLFSQFPFLVCSV